ncbi:MAG TPA: DNA topoisomerase IB [Candidatus Poseidoniales archaeon]|jgi:DNA topoisomerase-1|nr:DNA topoisomerase IB [Candidatus Poseidoniales archaeon]
MNTDSTIAAKLANLNISERSEPGISRLKIETPLDEEGDPSIIAYEYKLPDGKKLVDKRRISILNSLAVPPAWTDVWLCIDEKGHIQATGKDAKGRLQYRYHPDWNAIKADIKFANVDDFAMMLPRLRDRVKADLNLSGMPLEKSVALVIKLMDLYHIRIGSDEYAKQNESYGLTTLQEGHIKIIKGKKAEGKIDAIFDFIGKSGKHWKILIEDDDLAILIEESGKVGGKDKTQDLFRYENADGADFDVKAEHINNYIEDALDGTRYTAKEFRTWSASWKTGARLALITTASENLISNIPKLTDDALSTNSKEDGEVIIRWRGRVLRRPEGLAKLAANGKLLGKTEPERLATMLAVIDTVAGDLGNTRAVCRTSYIRPMLMEDWLSGRFEKRWQQASDLKPIPGLNRDESTVVHYMRKNE